MWRSYDAFRDGESPCVNVVRCLVLVCPAIGKLRMDVGDEWYVRVNGGYWLGARERLYITKADKWIGYDERQRMLTEKQGDD